MPDFNLPKASTKQRETPATLSLHERFNFVGLQNDNNA